MKKQNDIITTVLVFLLQSYCKARNIRLPTFDREDSAEELDDSSFEGVKKFLLTKIAKVNFSPRPKNVFKEKGWFFGAARKITYIYELVSLRAEGIQGSGIGPKIYEEIEALFTREGLTSGMMEKLAVERKRLMDLKCRDIPPLLANPSYKELLEIIFPIDNTFIPFKNSCQFAKGCFVFYEMFPDHGATTHNPDRPKTRFEPKITDYEEREYIHSLITESQNIIMDYYVTELGHYVKKEEW